MVGTPDRRYLWILSRTHQFDEATYQRLVERAPQLGYPCRNSFEPGMPPLRNGSQRLPCGYQQSIHLGVDTCP